MNQSFDPQRTLIAGVARGVITPPIGIRMLGYTVQEDCSQGAQRDLLATVLVLGDGVQSIVIAALDVVFVPMLFADRIRAEIGERLGIPPSHVLLNYSHTHLGPMFPTWQVEDMPQRAIQSQYVEYLQSVLAGLASVAWQNRKPARLGSSRGEAPLGVNRREKMPDGSVIIGENPNGAIDRTIDVIRIDELSGKPLAVLTSAACHTVVLGPKTLLLSPDFIGPARDVIEPAIGAPSLFLQGAAGNINPACGIGRGGPEQFEDAHRLGLMLGGETLKVWAQIRTHNCRGPRQVVRSVAALSTWEYEPLPQESITHFSTARRRMTLPLAPLPSLLDATQEVELKSKALKEAVGQGPINVARRRLAYAKQRYDLVSAGKQVVHKEIELWAFRINDLALAAVSAEPLAELGLEIKRRSQFAHTLFLGYSNGCIGYIPPPEAFAEGGMEVVESHVNYLLPSQLTPEWAPQVIGSTLELLHGLP